MPHQCFQHFGFLGICDCVYLSVRWLVGFVLFLYYSPINNVGVQRFSVVKCVILNLEAQGSSHTRFYGVLVGVPLGETLHNPHLVLVTPREYMNMRAVAGV